MEKNYLKILEIRFLSQKCSTKDRDFGIMNIA